MTLQEFKREAQRRGHFFDNSASASQAWARSWGLTFHSSLWFYKEYTLGNMRWKGGQIRLRHGSYRSVSCYINDEPVSEYRFNKALENFKAPVLTTEERAYIKQEQARRDAEFARIMARRKAHPNRTHPDIQQLQLIFEAV